MQKLLEGLPKIEIIRLRSRKPSFYKGLPETAGVYVYFRENTVIYIGKAINLKYRVSSYFNLDLEPKTKRMISEANFLSFIQVNSELEALLLEARLIRSYMPHYNIAAKDDKHPLYIRITNELYPRVLTARKIAETEKNLAFYGPFPSSSNVHSVLLLLRRIFKYSDHKIGKRGCLYSHIGLCDPCPSDIESLKNEIERIPLRKKYLANIRNLKSVLDGQIGKVTNNLNKDMMRSSKAEDYESATYFRNQIERLEYITRPQMPSEFYMSNPNLYEDIRKKETFELGRLIGLNGPSRIECFDIAHLAGSNATASMVTFINGEADKNFYRHFKIQTAKGRDDYDSMREVARRRSGHYDDWGRPDLIIVDGGLGQVAAFKEYLNDVPVVGVAKHPDRLIINGNKVKLSGVTLNLVARIRDEAHRFARRYHHSLISNSIKHANST